MVFEKDTPGLLTELMNKFIKIKPESPKRPKKCHTQEEKNRYIEEFLLSEGVRLEYSKIVNNPGRSSAKLMLNSFWDKLDQRKNPIVRHPAEFFTKMSNPSINIRTYDETLTANWKFKDDLFDSLSTVNM